jgi:hypothetical protein
MTVVAALLAAVFCGLSVPFFISFGTDLRRLREGARFRGERKAPSNGAFLEVFTESEIKALQAPRLEWVSKSLPDPRDVNISPSDARIYWRLALGRYQTSQMKSELALVLLSGVLGVALASLFSALAKVGLAVGPQEIALSVFTFVILIAAAFAVAIKVAVGRRWQEAIDLYDRIGRPSAAEHAKRTLLQRLLRPPQ